MWIATIPYQDSTGELRAHYDRQARALGEPTELTMAGSLYPGLVAARLDLYAATEKCPSRLSPHQRNLISFVTSAINRTAYCMSQVTIKLRATGLSDQRIVALAAAAGSCDADSPDGGSLDAGSLGLSEADAAVVAHAVKLTRDPGSITAGDIDELRAAGFDDLDIVDINSQCAHLNYVNRVVMGLGIHSVVDPDFGAYEAIPRT